MNRPLVIGFGNSLRQDDGLGRHAAELLRADADGRNIDILQCHQLTPELAADVAASSLVVFLDAAVDREPGCVSCEPVFPDRTKIWPHHLSAAQLMALAAELTDLLPPAFLVTGGIARTGWGEGLSAASIDAAQRMAGVAKSLLCRS